LLPTRRQTAFAKLRQDFAFGSPELRLLERNWFLQNKSQEICPTLYERRMCAPEPPFISKRQTCRPERALTILTDHHGLRIRDHGGNSCQSVENKRARPVAHFPHPHSAELPRHPETDQLRENSIPAETRADEHDRVSSVLGNGQLHLSERIKPVAE